MSCTVEFLIHSNNGTSSTIQLEVPDASEMTLEDAVGALMGNPEAYKEFITAVNTGGMPLANIDTKNIITDNHLPIGNYTLNTIRNQFDTPNIEHLVKLLQEEGVNLNEYNILLTDAKFSVNWNSNYGYYSYLGQNLAIIKPSAEYIEAYLKQKYVNTVLEKADKPQLDYIRSNIEAALKLIVADPTTSKRVLSTISKMGFSAETSKFSNISEGLSKFVNYFYTSAAFNDSLYKAGIIGSFNKMFNDIIGTVQESEIVYSNDLAMELVHSATVSGNYMRVNKANLEAFMEAHGYGEATDDNIVAAIQEINNAIEDGQFLDIAFIGADGIMLRKAYKQPVFDKAIVNTEYSGELVTNVETLSGYNIVSHNGKYYVSDKIITTEASLKGNGFESIKHAQNVVKTLLDRNIDLKAVTNKIKQGTSDKFTITSKSALEIGDRITSLDIPLNSQIDLYNDKELIKHITFNNFISELNKKPQYKKILTLLREQGITLETILDTPEKVSTFFLLKNQLRNPETHDLLYNSKVPSMLTEDKIKYETELIMETIATIQAAPEVVFEVTASVGDKYNLQKLTVNTNIPVHKKVPRSFKSEMIEIANHLGKNYGIKINIVTARELAAEFKGVIPYAGRTNAFIYNGEIFLNIDRATTSDSLHEFAHLMMGSIKRTNPDLYYGLVSQIEQVTSYEDKVQAFRNLGDTRAVPDINEEIFVTEFGNYFSKIADTWFEDKNSQLDELGAIFKEKTQKTFETSDDIKSEKLGRLLNMSIDEIMTEFGSALVNKDFEANFDMNLAAESRVITNLIQKLIKSGHLKEDC